jgi:hypothetical protein
MGLENRNLFVGQRYQVARIFTGFVIKNLVEFIPIELKITARMERIIFFFE